MELEISNVTKTYGRDIKALERVSLTVPTGMFGLLGPNGAGKSTLMRSVATLQEVDEGSIHLGSTNVLQDKEALRRVLGYLPQEFGLYPNVTAETLLSHLAVLKGITNPRERKTTVDALLERTNLWDARRRNLGTFSGGMKQRFGIAQALLGQPRLVIVDEPTAGLDPEERNRFLNLLSEIGENIIVILSTHIVDDVREVCNRMAILVEGRLVLTGDPSTAIDEIRGKTWKKEINRAQLGEYKLEHQVISTRLAAGKTIIHVFSENRPDATFVQAPPDLEDVYFTALAAVAGTAA
jgi:ABC-type multidrug transport system ATPase subunit